MHKFARDYREQPVAPCVTREIAVFLEFGTRLVKLHRKCPLDPKGGASGHAMPKRQTTPGERSRSHETRKILVISIKLTFCSATEVGVSTEAKWTIQAPGNKQGCLAT